MPLWWHRGCPAKDGKECASRKITQEEIQNRDDKDISNWKCCFISERLESESDGSFRNWTYCDPFKEEWVTDDLYNIAGIYVECLDNSSYIVVNGLIITFIILML